MEKGLKGSKTQEEADFIEGIKLLARRPELPRFAEVEPGALLYSVKVAWSQSQGRDGRKGHLSEQEIADKISRETGRPFSRNQFQAMFGDARRGAATGEARRQGIPRDIAYAYLRTAFYNWSIDHAAPKRPGHEKVGIPIQIGENLDLERIIENACDAMFSAVADRSDGQELLVRCRPSPGTGAKGFYEECGRQGHSIIYATPREPVKMKQPSRQILEWEALCDALVGPSTTSRPIHVWAIREPLISRDSRHTGALYGIGFFQTILMMAKALNVLDKPSEQSLWHSLVERGVVAVKKHPDNDRFRQGRPAVEVVPERHTASILEEMIFPSSVPDRWRSRNNNLRPDDLDLLVAVRREKHVEYNLFSASDLYEIPPVVHYPTPSADSDDSFVFLYKACRQFLKENVAASLQKEADKQDEHSNYLELAEGEGWELFSLDAFIHTEFPLAYKQQRNTSELRGKTSKTGE